MTRLPIPHRLLLALLFLAAPEASYVNGARIPVDGGYTILGHLVEGEDIRQQIENVPVHAQYYQETSAPDNPVVITSASITSNVMFGWTLSSSVP